MEIKIKNFTEYFDGHWNSGDVVMKKNGQTIELFISDAKGNPLDDGMLLTIKCGKTKSLEIHQAQDVDIKLQDWDKISITK